jgi:hypothetical protein
MTTWIGGFRFRVLHHDIREFEQLVLAFQILFFRLVSKKMRKLHGHYLHCHMGKGVKHVRSRRKSGMETTRPRTRFRFSVPCDYSDTVVVVGLVAQLIYFVASAQHRPCMTRQHDGIESRHTRRVQPPRRWPLRVVITVGDFNAKSAPC